MQILVKTQTANIQLNDYCISVISLKKKKDQGRELGKEKEKAGRKGTVQNTDMAIKKHMVLREKNENIKSV